MVSLCIFLTKGKRKHARSKMPQDVKSPNSCIKVFSLQLFTTSTRVLMEKDKSVDLKQGKDLHSYTSDNIYIKREVGQ